MAPSNSDLFALCRPALPRRVFPDPLGPICFGQTYAVNFPALAVKIYNLKPKFLRHLNSCKVRPGFSPEKSISSLGDGQFTPVRKLAAKGREAGR